MVDEVFLEGTNCECDVTLDTWLKDSLPDLPGVVRSVAERQLILACREFFDRTYAWQVALPDQHAKAGARQYWLSPYDQVSNVVGVLGIGFNGTQLTPLKQRPARIAESTTPSHYYAASIPDCIELFPQLTEDVDEALTFYLALTPKQSVEHLPRIAAIKFYDAILDGFLARMYMQPNKPYSQPQLGVERRRSFVAAISRFKGLARQGFVQAQDWAYPASWGVRRRW